MEGKERREVTHFQFVFCNKLLQQARFVCKKEKNTKSYQAEAQSVSATEKRSQRNNQNAANFAK